MTTQKAAAVYLMSREDKMWIEMLIRVKVLNLQTEYMFTTSLL